VAYRADIEIAVRGAQELKRLQNQIKTTGDAIDSLNSGFAGVANLLPKSLNNLKSVVAEAATNFNKVVLGTEEAVTAAKDYVKATRELNAGLQERLRLIRNIEAAETAAQRQIIPTTNAGYGQQMPALPPAFVRSREIQQSWTTFFNEAADLATELNTSTAAKALNLKQSWNTFFTDAAELATELKTSTAARALNLKQSWNTFFTDAAELATELKTSTAARALNLKQSWNTFFTDAAELATELKTSTAARALNLKQSWSAALNELEDIALTLRAQAANAASRARLRQAETLSAYQQATRPQPENLGYGGTALALRPAGFTDQDVRIKNLLDDQAKGIRINAELERRLSVIQNNADLAAIQKELSAELDAIELIAAKRKREGDAWWAEQERRLKAQPEITTGTTAGAGLRGRAGGAISSALIGGGFPLLFGQGPAAAAGGALGGLAGGLLGGGFGFALSIAGTAIGDFIAQTDKLSVSLSGLNATLFSTSSAFITTAGDISELAKNLRITKDEAIELISTFSQFNTGTAREALARGFGAVGGAQTFEAIAKAGIGEKEALDAIFSLRKQIGNEAAEQLALQLRAVGATETQAALLKIVSERNIDILVAQSKTVQFADRLLSTWENIVAAVASSVSLAARFIQKMQEGSLIKLPFLDRIEKVLGRVVGRTPEQIAGQRGAALEQQLRKDLNDIRAALRQETSAQATQAAIGESLRPQRKGKSAAEREAERLAEKIAKQKDEALKALAVETGRLQVAETADPLQQKITQAIVKQFDIQRQYAAKIKESLSAEATLNYQLAERKALQANALALEAELNAEVDKVTDSLSRLVAEAANRLELENRYQELLDQGINPELAKEFAQLELTAEKQRETLTLRLAELEAARSKLSAESEVAKALERQISSIKEILALQGKSVDKAKQDTEEQQKKDKDRKDKIQQAKDQAELVEQQIAAIGSSLGDVLTGALDNVINKTKDWNQFLSDALMSIGKVLMMAGLNMLAGTDGEGVLSFLGFGSGFRKRAAGGPVTGGSPYLVGERGPELFVPGTGGSVVPANDLRAAMGAAPGSSGGSPVLNMSFESTNIGGVEYVSRDQLEQAMAATRRQAANDGAKRGMSMTLDRLQQSPQTRRRVGI